MASSEEYEGTFAAIVAIREQADGAVVIVDAAGSEHIAHNGAALWIMLKRIISDPKLPGVGQESEDNVDIGDVIVNYVENHMPPGLEPLARPAFNQLLDIIDKRRG